MVLHESSLVTLKHSNKSLDSSVSTQPSCCPWFSGTIWTPVPMYAFSLPTTKQLTPFSMDTYQVSCKLNSVRTLSVGRQDTKHKTRLSVTCASDRLAVGQRFPSLPPWVSFAEVAHSTLEKHCLYWITSGVHNGVTKDGQTGQQHRSRCGEWAPPPQISWGSPTWKL